MANLQLAKNLFYLRTISGLKQDDIADIFNISRQACSNYETSTRTPDLGYLASFAAHFHVTMDQLILCDLEAEHFIPESEYPSGMRETVTSCSGLPFKRAAASRRSALSFFMSS